MGIMGGASGVNNVLDRGGSAGQAALGGAVEGGVNAIIGAFMGPNIPGPQFTSRLGARAYTAAANAGLMGGARLAENAVAGHTYDKGRSLTEGVGQEAAMGGAMGLLAGNTAAQDATVRQMAMEHPGGPEGYMRDLQDASGYVNQGSEAGAYTPEQTQLFNLKASRARDVVQRMIDSRTEPTPAPNAPKSLSFKIQGDNNPVELTNPEHIQEYNNAVSAHEARVDALKNTPMTSQARHDAIQASGDELLQTKLSLKDKVNARKIEGPTEMDQFPSGAQGPGGEGGEGVGRSLQGAQAPGEGGTQEAAPAGQALPQEANQVAFHELPAEKQDQLRASIQNEAKALADDPSGTVNKYRALPETLDGRIVNGDSYNKLLPTYAANPRHGVPAMETGAINTLVDNAKGMSEIKSRAIDRTLQEGKDAIVTVGGQGSGKTTMATRLIEKNPDLFGMAIDAPHEDPDSLIKIVNGLKTKGINRVWIAHPETDVGEAFRRTIDRSKGDEGRFIQPDRFTNAHYGAPKALERAAEEFRNDPRVGMLIAKGDDELIGGPMDEGGKDAYEHLRNAPPMTPEDIDNAVKKNYLELRRANLVPEDVARSIETNPAYQVGPEGIQGSNPTPELGYRGPRAEVRTLENGSGLVHGNEPSDGGQGSGPTGGVVTPESLRFDHPEYPVNKYEALDTRTPNQLGQRGKDLMSKGAAEVALGDARRRYATREARDMISKLPVAEQHKMFDWFEKSREEVEDSGLQEKIKDGILSAKDEMDQRYANMEKLGIAPEYVENYFPHLWKDFKKAKRVFSQFNHSPYEGSKTAIKKRTIPTVAQGIKMGLKPLFDNPLDQWYAASVDADKYLFAHAAFDAFQNEGLVKTSTGHLPEGWDYLKDPIAVKRGGMKGERYIGPDPLARAFNNYLSPGIGGRAKTAYGFTRKVANGLNQAQLSLSGFHFFFVSFDASTLDIARGIQQGIQDGRFLRGAATAIKGMTPGYSQVADYKAGKDIQKSILTGEDPSKDWLIPGLQGWSSGDMHEWLTRGGLRIGLDPEYSNRMSTSVAEGFRRAMDTTLTPAERGTSAARTALGLWGNMLQTLSHPLMEAYVPRVKIGVYFSLLADELERAQAGGRLLGEAEKDRTARRIADLVENRLGQLTYDNLFWNKVTKQISMLAFRSVGWNVGSLRDIGGHWKDLAELTASPLRGKSSEEYASEGAHGNLPQFTTRLAAWFGSLILTGVIGGMITYLSTRNAPADTKDLYAPRIPGKGKNGHPNRMMVPNYIKDELELLGGTKSLLELNPRPLAEMASNKLGPALSVGWSILNNRDWKGNEIYSERSGLPGVAERAGDLGKLAAGSVAPIGLKKALQDYQEGGKAKAILPILGIMPPPSQIANTKAENLALRMVVNKSKTVLSPEDADLQERKKEAGEAYNSGYTKPLLDMLHNGEIQPKQFQSIIRAHQNADYLGALAKRLGFKELLQVYDAANSIERQHLKPIVNKAMARDMRKIPMKERPKLMEEWNKLKAQ
jgi:hypothetical protein